MILTAANADQADAYQLQIEYRKRNKRLPQDTKYLVIPDPGGKRIGSGGSTMHVLREIARVEGSGRLSELKILLLHSGGDARRIPQYSACGKIFSTIPRRLEDGCVSTLFDECMVGMCMVPSRISAGMLACSGDVLFLFNSLQLDFHEEGAAAFSMKEKAEMGQQHGVFLGSGNGYVHKFLHKRGCEELERYGAIDSRGRVNIDTGTVFFSGQMVKVLYGLSERSGIYDLLLEGKLNLSLYADFLYPMAETSMLQEYLQDSSEGEVTENLKQARRNIWDVLHSCRLKLICFSPAVFLHFGTTEEVRFRMTDEIKDFETLGWKRSINSNFRADGSAAVNAYIDPEARVGKGAFLENCVLLPGGEAGEHCVISGLAIHEKVPDHTMVHGVPLKDGRYVVQILDVLDNPKKCIWMGKQLSGLLWEEPLFPVCENMEEALSSVLNPATDGGKELLSMKKSSELADINRMLAWQEQIRPLERAFSQLKESIERENLRDMPAKIRIRKEEVTVRLPLRVNFGGGWSDTPPYCLEHGGSVLNAAVILNGLYPAVAAVRRLEEDKIVLSSSDIGSRREYTDYLRTDGCEDPSDPFSLHKAALIVCGILEKKDNRTVREICSRLGGGFLLDTNVEGVPRGSGLGTSSILGAACVLALSRFTGILMPENVLFRRVLWMEQIMSTGGGWEDQAGGVLPGIKLVETKPGIRQEIQWTPLMPGEEIQKELKERFVLIYTGQRRLARNLLKEIMGRYFEGEEATIETLGEIRKMAGRMKEKLQLGDLEAFAELMNRHWELSRRLDPECTNMCIDHIFLTIEDLIAGKMICGAGGGGFLQVLTKRGVTKEQIRDRLEEVYEDSGVAVWEAEIVF